MKKEITTYAEFWDFYLTQHSQWATKCWHVAGTLLGVGWLLYCFLDKRPLWFPLALVPGYGLAWYSHFLIEKNRPATFQYPLWSFVSDFRMVYLVLSGKLKKETHP